jgi:hypothetical protein
LSIVPHHHIEVFSTKPYWRIGSKRIQKKKKKKKKEKAKLVPVENIRKAATQHTLPLPFWVRHIDPSIPFLPYSVALFFGEYQFDTRTIGYCNPHFKVRPLAQDSMLVPGALYV